MRDYSDEIENLPPQRSVFLKVLCILTFIFSSYTILTQAYIYFQAEQTSMKMEEAKNKITNEKTKSPEESSFLKKVMGGMSELSTPENLRKLAVGNLISSAFCLLGAFLMWRLKRTGFYLYVLGTIVGIIAPFYLF